MKNNISGIYAIINNVNEKRYIGSSIRLNYRWKQEHQPQLRKRTHYNRHLQNAWNKYGENSFCFEVIEECNQSELAKREGHWIEHFESWDRSKGYNLTRQINGRIVRYDQETHGEIIKLFKEGTSKSAIAKELAITRSTVYSCLERNCLHENTGKGSEVKLTEEVRKQAEELREQDKSWNEISKIVGVSKTQLYRTKTIDGDGKYCDSRVKRETYRTVTPEVIAKVEELRAKNMTWSEIETELGVSRFALHQNGLTKTHKPLSRKVPKNKMTEDKKEAIQELRKHGKSLKEISVITGVSQSTIRYHGLHKCR